MLLNNKSFEFLDSELSEECIYFTKIFFGSEIVLFFSYNTSKDRRLTLSDFLKFKVESLIKAFFEILFSLKVTIQKQ